MDAQDGCALGRRGEDPGAAHELDALERRAVPRRGLDGEVEARREVPRRSRDREGQVVPVVRDARFAAPRGLVAPRRTVRREHAQRVPAVREVGGVDRERAPGSRRRVPPPVDGQVQLVDRLAARGGARCRGQDDDAAEVPRRQREVDEGELRVRPRERVAVQEALEGLVRVAAQPRLAQRQALVRVYVQASGGELACVVAGLLDRARRRARALGDPARHLGLQKRS